MREDGTLFGTNNDWLGFLGNMKACVPGWRADAGPAVVLGGGGGARAICHALVEDGAPEVRLVNRNRDRAEAVAADIGGPITLVDWDDRVDALVGAALLDNTTSAGMVGQPGLEMPLARLCANAVVSDIVYTPLETPLLATARARGNSTVNGLGMLLYQGPPAWKMWFGVEPVVTDELRLRMEASIRDG